MMCSLVRMDFFLIHYLCYRPSLLPSLHRGMLKQGLGSAFRLEQTDQRNMPRLSESPDAERSEWTSTESGPPAAQINDKEADRRIASPSLNFMASRFFLKHRIRKRGLRWRSFCIWADFLQRFMNNMISIILLISTLLYSAPPVHFLN